MGAYDGERASVATSAGLGSFSTFGKNIPRCDNQLLDCIGGEMELPFHNGADTRQGGVAIFDNQVP